MNIEKLIAAAKEIDRLALLQEDRAKRMGELAAQARKATDPHELRKIQNESRSAGVTVVDFGGAVNALRRALRAKPAKSIQHPRPSGLGEAEGREVP